MIKPSASDRTFLRGSGFGRVVPVVTSPIAVTVCRKVIDEHGPGAGPAAELTTWLDVG